MGGLFKQRQQVTAAQKQQSMMDQLRNYQLGLDSQRLSAQTQQYQANMDLANRQALADSTKIKQPDLFASGAFFGGSGGSMLGNGSGGLRGTFLGGG